MLNLGDINFGVDIDTSPLGASIDKIVQFGKAVERAAQLTGEGAQYAATQLRRQEAAALSALQQTLNFQQSVYRRGGSQDAIDQTTDAFGRLASQLTTVKGTELDNQRAMEGFRASMGAARRETIDYIDANKTVIEKQAQFFADTQSGSGKLIKMSGDLDRLTASSTSFFAETQAGSSKLITLGRNVDQLAASLRNAGQAEQVFFSQSQSGSARLIAMSRAIHDFQQIPNAGGAGNFVEILRSLASAATLTYGPLSGAGARVTALTHLLNTSNLAIAGFVGGIALATAAVFELSKGAVETALKLSIIQQRFEAIGGTANFASIELGHIHDLAIRLGVDFLTLSDSFSRFVVAAEGSGLPFKTIQNIFDTFSAAGAKLHLANDDMSRIFLALEQMLSKGTVSSEELRKQLGNALPGAFRMAAASMGMTNEAFNKFLRSGAIASVDLLPKLAAQLARTFGVGPNTQIDTLQASLGRLSTSTTDLFASFDQATGVSIAFKKVIDELASTFEALAGIMHVIPEAGQAISSTFTLLENPLNVISLAFEKLHELIPGFANLADFSIWRDLGRWLGIADDSLKQIGDSFTGTGGKIHSSVADIEKYITSLHHASLTNSDFSKQALDDLHAHETAIRALIAADNDRLKIRTSDQSGDFMAVDSIGSWILNRNRIEEATNSLKKHQGDLAKVAQDIKELTRLWEEETRAEKAALNQKTADQRDALDAITEQLHRQKALQDASKQGAQAVRDLQDTYAKQDKFNTFLKLMEKAGEITGDQTLKVKKLVETSAEAGNFDFAKALSGSGLTGKALADAQEFFNTFETKRELIPKAAKDLQGYLNVLRDTQQNFARATSLMQGEGFLEGLNKKFEIQDKADQAADRIRRLGLGAEEAARRAKELTESLQALSDAEAQVAEVAAIQTIVRNNEMADALLKGKDAVTDLQQAWEREDAIKSFSDRIASLNLGLIETTNLIDMFKQSLDNVDNAKFAESAKGLTDIAPKLKEIKDLFSDFAKASDKAATDFSQALTEMAFSGSFNLSKLGDIFVKEIESMIAETLKLQVIKPLFDSVFGSFGSNGQPSGNGLFGLLGSAFGMGSTSGGLEGNFNKASGASGGGVLSSIGSLFSDFVGLFDDGGAIGPGQWGIKSGKPEIIQGGTHGVSVKPMDAMNTGGGGSYGGSTVVYQTLHFHNEGVVMAESLYERMLKVGEKAAKEGARGGFALSSKNFEQMQAQSSLLAR